MDAIEIIACAPRIAGSWHSLAAMFAFVWLAHAFRNPEPCVARVPRSNPPIS